MWRETVTKALHSEELILQWVLNSRALTVHGARLMFFLFIAISSHKVLDEQKPAFFLLLDAGNSFVLAMLLFVIHKVCFSLEFFGSFLFPVRVWRRKLFSSVSYAPLTVPLSYTAQGKEKQNPWHRAEMLHYMVCPG